MQHLTVACLPLQFWCFMLFSFAFTFTFLSVAFLSFDFLPTIPIRIWDAASGSPLRCWKIWYPVVINASNAKQCLAAGFWSVSGRCFAVRKFLWARVMPWATNSSDFFTFSAYQFLNTLDCSIKREMESLDHNKFFVTASISGSALAPLEITLGTFSYGIRTLANLVLNNICKREEKQCHQGV